MIETIARPIRVLGLLNGDIADRSGDARIKYGLLFAALARHCDLLAVRDVELRGLDRCQNALRTMRWPRERWRAAFRTNTWSFERRTDRARSIARAYQNEVDILFQHGTIFAAGERTGPPVVIYTDFTYRLAQREHPAGDPFASRAEQERWNALEGAAARGAAYILTRSAHARRSLIDDYGIPPARVAVVGGGLNFEAIPAPAPLDAPRVLFIGRDFERKGGDTLVAAFRLARERVPEAELWMVTGRADVSGPGIRRIAPTYDRAAIAALYRASSIYAMPSRLETWGDVFLEAMAYGLPCIGSANDAMPEIIEHDRTGYIVQREDVVGLAGYLERLLREPALRRQLGGLGRQRVAARFTWDRVVQRMLPYFERARMERPALPTGSPEYPAAAGEGW